MKVVPKNFIFEFSSEIFFIITSFHPKTISSQFFAITKKELLNIFHLQIYGYYVPLLDNVLQLHQVDFLLKVPLQL